MHTSKSHSGRRISPEQYIIEALSGYLASAVALGILRSWLSCLTVIAEPLNVGIPFGKSAVLVQCIALLLTLVILSFPVARAFASLPRRPLLIVLGFIVGVLYIGGTFFGEKNAVLGIVSTCICVAYFPIALAFWGEDNKCRNFGYIVVRVAFSFVIQYIFYATLLFVPQFIRIYIVCMLPLIAGLLLDNSQRAAAGIRQSSSDIKQGGACEGRKIMGLFCAVMCLCALGHGTLASVAPTVTHVWFLGHIILSAVFFATSILLAGSALFRSILSLTLLMQCVFIIPYLIFPDTSEWIILARSFSYAVSIGLATTMGSWIGGTQGNGGLWNERLMLAFIGPFYGSYFLMLELAPEPTVRFFLMFFFFVVAAAPLLVVDPSAVIGSEKVFDANETGEGGGEDKKIVHQLSYEYNLTRREGEVLVLMLGGLSAESIATQLAISKNTVRSQIQSIYRKLDLHNRRDLLALIDMRAGQQTKSEA